MGRRWTEPFAIVARAVQKTRMATELLVRVPTARAQSPASSTAPHRASLAEAERILPATANVFRQVPMEAAAAMAAPQDQGEAIGRAELLLPLRAPTKTPSADLYRAEDMAENVVFSLGQGEIPRSIALALSVEFVSTVGSEVSGGPLSAAQAPRRRR